MNDKEYNNMFRFSLYQCNVLLCEKMFDADNFNPFTRYSIDVRDILPKAITRLQKTLSRRNYDVVYQTGRIDQTVADSEQTFYDLYSYHRKMINSYPSSYRDDMHYEPVSIVQKIEDKTISGVECKVGLYINDNPIVERVFYVNGFNPVARWSIDIVDVVTEIGDTIFDKIKKIDIKNMWDDYDLINQRGLSIVQVRELSVPKREEMLRRLRRN